MTNDEAKLTVFLLDDHQVVRDGLRYLLESAGDIEVVGEADTGADAIEGIRRTSPKVAVLDVRLPDISGVEVCREVRSAQPDVACLMLTSFADDDAMFGAVMAGAAGYVLKEVRGSDLVSDVRKVAAGHSLLEPQLVAKVMQRVREKADHPVDRLTSQERRILELIAEGMSNRQIAEALYLSEKTVKNYVSALLSKLGMARRTEAAVYAVRENIGRHDSR